MKTLKQKRNRKIAMMALAILSIIATICIATDPVKGAGATIAMATVVGTVTLEGKEEALYLALNESIQNEIKKHTSGYISEAKMTENINKALEKFAPNLKDNEDLKAMGTKLETALTALKEQGLEMKALKERNGKEMHKTIAEQLKAHKEANKEAWDKLKNLQPGASGFTIELKVAGTMLESTHTGAGTYFPAVEIVPGAVDLARRKPSLLSYMNYSGTNSRIIIWVEKTNPEGNAGWIGEGDVKPLIDFEYKTVTSEIKKIADKIKVSTEMLDDIDFLAGEIRNELMYQVDITVDASILSGAGGDEIEGITHWASAYALTTVKTTTPNNYDAIKAAATQIRNLYFEPTYAFVNPIDMANMELTKNADGSYIIPPFATATGNKITGLTVVESAAIPVGYLLVGDMSRVKIREKGTFGVTVGWVNDDFEKNLVTMIGERRMHLFVADNDSAALVYDTFENIKTACTQA